MSPARSAKRANVFLNLPFDAQHEKIYLALIAGLAALGLTPRCVLEIQPTSARLTRLLRLISSCEYSIHDLSRVQLSPTAPRCPRFNMPFEYLNRLNRDILSQIELGGEAFLSNTVVDGKFALRACIVIFGLRSRTWRRCPNSSSASDARPTP